MIAYKIDVADELKRDIERAIEDKVDEIADDEQFTIVIGDKAILGTRSRDIVVIEQIIEKVI